MKPKRNTFQTQDSHVSETRLDGWGSADLPLCAYCGQPFEPRRRDQKFGDPSTERHLNWERKEALILAVADVLKAIGGRARNMLTVARLCVEAAYDAVFQAMIALGYKYDERHKIWRTKKAATNGV